MSKGFWMGCHFLSVTTYTIIRKKKEVDDRWERRKNKTMARLFREKNIRNFVRAHTIVSLGNEDERGENIQEGYRMVGNEKKICQYYFWTKCHGYLRTIRWKLETWFVHRKSFGYILLIIWCIFRCLTLDPPFIMSCCLSEA